MYKNATHLHDLLRQLARRGQHQRLALPHGRVDRLEDRDGEGGRLARTCCAVFLFISRGGGCGRLEGREGGERGMWGFGFGGWRLAFLVGGQVVRDVLRRHCDAQTRKMVFCTFFNHHSSPLCVVVLVLPCAFLPAWTAGLP